MYYNDDVMVVSLYYNDDAMVISLLHLGMTPLCRVGSTVLAPPSLLYQIFAVPVNNTQSMSKLIPSQYWV